MKKKLIPLIGSGVVAILIAVCCMLCLERVSDFCTFMGSDLSNLEE